MYNKEKLGVAWRWEAAATACGARRRSTAELARVLRGKRVHFVGDSHSVRFGNWLFARLAGEHGRGHTVWRRAAAARPACLPPVTHGAARSLQACRRPPAPRM